MPNQSRMLLIQGQPNQKVQYPVVMLTKIGIEITQIVKVPFSLDLGRELANRLPKGGLKQIAYAGVVPSAGGITFVPTEILWSEPSQGG